MKTRHLLSIILALPLGLPGVGCKGENKKTEDSASTPTDRTVEAVPSARVEGEVHRNLLDEVGRAELRSQGLVINLGTGDQHKYTRGGWKTGWKVSDSTSPSAATTSWARGVLDVLLDAEPVELVVRARSLIGGHKIVPYIDRTALSGGELTAEWQTLRFAVPAGKVAAGTRALSFRFPKSGKTHTEIDWIHVAEAAGVDLPPIEPVALPVAIGGRPKRALVAPSARSYSFYIEPADGEKLIVDVGSEVGATLEVRAHTDGSDSQVLWSGTGTSEWAEIVVDLSGLAAKAVRLELASSGAVGVSGWGEPVLMRPEREIADAGGPAKNVIYILIDTARADAFLPGSDIKTPAYDALAAESTHFRAAYNNENWTKPSVLTALSGVYPSTHGTKQDDSSVPKDLEIIPERLRRAGFATAGFVANGYVSKKFGFGKGWDTFKNYIRLGKPSHAEIVYRDAMSWLEKNVETGKRGFLYIQTIDPHVAYSVPETYWRPYFDGTYTGFLGPTVAADELNAMSAKKGAYNRRDLAWLKALYAGEITYHDEFMGKFFADAKAKGLLADTAIIISNDHGEETGDRDGFGHGHSLYEELTLSPLLINYPPLFAGGRVVDDIVEHVDLVPTMLDLLGLPPAPHTEGQSLVPLVAGEPVPRPLYAITEFLDGRRAVRVGRYKLMRSSGDWLRVFDLGADPGERANIAGKAAIARRLCETYMGEGIAVPTKARRQQDLVARQSFEAGKADISPELRKEFEALGYFGARPKPQD